MFLFRQHVGQKEFHYFVRLTTLHYRNLVRSINLTIDKEGKIEFEIGDRKLFETTQFKIVKIENQRDESIGLSRGLLKYKGQINKGKIQLTCDSEFQDCWTNELIFEKVK